MSQIAEEALALLQKGDKRGAMLKVNSGLNKDPDDMTCIIVGAQIINRDSAFGMAYNLLKLAAGKGKPHFELLNNIGMTAASIASVSGEERFLDEAEGCLSMAYQQSDDPAIKANLALVMLHKLRLDEAEKYALECLEADPGNEQARETISYVHLHRGNWVKGFGNYEWTLGGKYRDVPKEAPYWEPGMRGKRILMRGEQGIGDEITYSSVLSEAQNDNFITLDCDARLKGLMQRTFPKIEVHGTRFTEKPAWGTFDAAMLTGSLCREYRQKDEDFPRKGFLIADPERRVQWKSLLQTLPGKKIGIAWTGGVDNTFKNRRSFDLERLKPLLEIPGITWVSLQYNNPGDVGIKHWGRAVDKGVDYDETAALVSELDAVVSVTTAIVHLCGALGKKCYVLVPEKCRWFYASETSRHRWYDSLELFRQKGDWPLKKLIGRLKEDLA